MPYYNYICTKCNHEWEELRKISEMNIPIESPCPSCNENGNIETRIYGAPGFGDPVKMGFNKPSSDFRDLLRNVHKKTPGSQLDKNSVLTPI